MRCQSIVGLCSDCFRQDCLIIDIIIASDFPGIVAVHFDDLREIVVDGIEGQSLQGQVKSVIRIHGASFEKIISAKIIIYKAG